MSFRAWLLGSWRKTGGMDNSDRGVLLPPLQQAEGFGHTPR
jgi:hypothetical protein